MASARTVDPHPAAILDAALGRVGRIDLDEHVLLQLGEPLVGARLLAATFVFDQAARREDERELLGDALLHRGLLHVEAHVGHAELPCIGQRRILGDELRPRRVDRLAVHGDRIRQAERVRTRLAVAVVDAAVLHGHALDAARQIDRPGDTIRIGAADTLDGCALSVGQIRVPAELLEHAVGELRISVLDLGAQRIGAFGEKVVLHLLLDLLAVRPSPWS